MLLFVMAAIVLTGSALAGSDAGKKADLKKMSEAGTLDKQKYLEELQKMDLEGLALCLLHDMERGCRFTGIQGSGGVNAAGDVQGVQVAVMGNLDMRIRGCQIGLCNVITDSSVPFLPVVNMSF